MTIFLVRWLRPQIILIVWNGLTFNSLWQNKNNPGSGWATHDPWENWLEKCAFPLEKRINLSYLNGVLKIDHTTIWFDPQGNSHAMWTSVRLIETGVCCTWWNKKLCPFTILSWTLLTKQPTIGLKRYFNEKYVKGLSKFIKPCH